MNKRLSSISANEAVFDQACPPYQEALNKSGYNHKLKFSPPEQNVKKSPKRKRKITWFNPPFSQNVQTKIGEKFLKIIEKNFPPGHPLAKIVNKNTVKVSYRCMPNMKREIAKHNFKVQREKEPETEPECNCTGRCGPCPLGGGCLINNVVYRAKVVQTDQTENTYTGLTSQYFKDRWYGHRSTFDKKDHDKHTTLSTHVWDLKDQNKNFEISWNIVDRASSFDPATRKCRLCLKEKYYILYHPTGASLNERYELFSTCRHRLQKL